ncbi:hypothetical protein OG266_38760 [Streptomyces sp. NBC_00554]|uniref:hypothetical protein n=1 Tax=Streptomyces sp. NBC_00554 TaxID=2903661 RepID=UPI00352D488C|nr:hypothetical protein OG266_38760 [Streptomyces sp. NBC_00554]
MNTAIRRTPAVAVGVEALDIAEGLQYEMQRIHRAGHLPAAARRGQHFLENGVVPCRVTAQTPADVLHS